MALRPTHLHVHVHSTVTAMYTAGPGANAIRLQQNAKASTVRQLHPCTESTQHTHNYIIAYLRKICYQLVALGH